MNKFLVKASKAFRRGEKGFTLVELLIVIAIIAILAAIIIPNVARIIKEGNIAAARAERAELQVGVDAAMAHVGLSSIGTQTLSSGDLSLEFATTTEALTEWLVRTVNVKGVWNVGTDGTVTFNSYPGLTSADVP